METETETELRTIYLALALALALALLIGGEKTSGHRRADERAPAIQSKAAAGQETDAERRGGRKTRAGGAAKRATTYRTRRDRRWRGSTCISGVVVVLVVGCGTAVRSLLLGVVVPCWATSII